MNTPPILERGDALTVDGLRRALSANGDFLSIKDIAVEDIGAGSGAMASILRSGLDYNIKPLPAYRG